MQSLCVNLAPRDQLWVCNKSTYQAEGTRFLEHHQIAFSRQINPFGNRYKTSTSLQYRKASTFNIIIFFRKKLSKVVIGISTRTPLVRFPSNAMLFHILGFQYKCVSCFNIRQTKEKRSYQYQIVTSQRLLATNHLTSQKKCNYWCYHSFRVKNIQHYLYLGLTTLVCNELQHTSAQKKNEMDASVFILFINLTPRSLYKSDNKIWKQSLKTFHSYQLWQNHLHEISKRSKK